MQSIKIATVPPDISILLMQLSPGDPTGVSKNISAIRSVYAIGSVHTTSTLLYHNINAFVQPHVFLTTTERSSAVFTDVVAGKVKKVWSQQSYLNGFMADFELALSTVVPDKSRNFISTGLSPMRFVCNKGETLNPDRPSSLYCRLNSGLHAAQPHCQPSLVKTFSDKIISLNCTACPVGTYANHTGPGPCIFRSVQPS